MKEEKEINLNDVPEKTVQNNFYYALMEEYGYQKRNIELEFNIRIGSSSRRADIVIFYENARHIQQNIFLIVEVKKFNSMTSKKNAFDQLYSYVSACGNCKYGILVTGQNLSYFSWQNKLDGRRNFVSTEGIPYNFDRNNLISKKNSTIVYNTNTINKELSAENLMAIGCFVIFVVVGLVLIFVGFACAIGLASSLNDFSVNLSNELHRFVEMKSPGEIQLGKFCTTNYIDEIIETSNNGFIVSGKYAT